MSMHGRMGGPGGGPGMGGPGMGGPGSHGPRGGSGRDPMSGPGMPPPPPPRQRPFGRRYNRGCGSLGCGGCLLPILSAILVIAAAFGMIL